MCNSMKVQCATDTDNKMEAKFGESSTTDLLQSTVGAEAYNVSQTAKRLKKTTGSQFGGG
jgi:hypothetical protein